MDENRSGCFVCLPLGRKKTGVTVNGTSKTRTSPTARETRVKELEAADLDKITVQAHVYQLAKRQESSFLANSDSSYSEVGSPLPHSLVKEKPSLDIDKPVVPQAEDKENNLLNEVQVKNFDVESDTKTSLPLITDSQQVENEPKSEQVTPPIPTTTPESATISTESLQPPAPVTPPPLPAFSIKSPPPIPIPVSNVPLHPPAVSPTSSRTPPASMISTSLTPTSSRPSSASMLPPTSTVAFSSPSPTQPKVTSSNRKELSENFHSTTTREDVKETIEETRGPHFSEIASRVIYETMLLKDEPSSVTASSLFLSKNKVISTEIPHVATTPPKPSSRALVDSALPGGEEANVTLETEKMEAVDEFQAPLFLDKDKAITTTLSSSVDVPALPDIPIFSSPFKQDSRPFTQSTLPSHPVHYSDRMDGLPNIPLYTAKPPVFSSPYNSETPIYLAPQPLGYASSGLQPVFERKAFSYVPQLTTPSSIFQEHVPPPSQPVMLNTLIKPPQEALFMKDRLGGEYALKEGQRIYGGINATPGTLPSPLVTPILRENSNSRPPFLIPMETPNAFYKEEVNWQYPVTLADGYPEAFGSTPMAPNSFPSFMNDFIPYNPVPPPLSSPYGPVDSAPLEYPVLPNLNPVFAQNSFLPPIYSGGFPHGAQPSFVNPPAIFSSVPVNHPYMFDSSSRLFQQPDRPELQRNDTLPYHMSIPTMSIPPSHQMPPSPSPDNVFPSLQQRKNDLNVPAHPKNVRFVDISTVESSAYDEKQNAPPHAEDSFFASMKDRYNRAFCGSLDDSVINNTKSKELRPPRSILKRSPPPVNFPNGLYDHNLDGNPLQYASSRSVLPPVNSPNVNIFSSDLRNTMRAPLSGAPREQVFMPVPQTYTNTTPTATSGKNAFSTDDKVSFTAAHSSLPTRDFPAFMPTREQHGTLPSIESHDSISDEAILIPSLDGGYELYTLLEFTTLCKEKGVPERPALKINRNDPASIQSALYVTKHILGVSSATSASTLESGTFPVPKTTKPTFSSP